MLRLFFIDTRRITVTDELLSMMSDHRLSKINRLKNEHSQLQSIAAELSLINAVREFYPDASLPIAYRTLDGGKPVLCDYPLLKINISHSGDYAVCAVSDNEIGIDIQKTRRANFRIAQRYFTSTECEYIGNDESRFFELWAKKESYVKATGTGLTVPLNSFSVLENGNDFEFIELAPPEDGYVVCVCILKPKHGETT